MLDSKRLKFVEGELGYRRYIFLQPVAQWKEDFKLYQRDVFEWRHDRHANKAMGQEHRNKKLKIPVMPPYPSYMPKEDDIKQMVVMARRNEKGWHSIQAYKTGTSGSTEKIRARRSSMLPTSTEEALVENFVTPADDFQLTMMDAQHELRDSNAYNEAMSSATTLYTQSESKEASPREVSKENTRKVKHAWLAGEQISRLTSDLETKDRKSRSSRKEARGSKSEPALKRH